MSQLVAPAAAQAGVGVPSAVAVVLPLGLRVGHVMPGLVGRRPMHKATTEQLSHKTLAMQLLTRIQKIVDKFPKDDHRRINFNKYTDPPPLLEAPGREWYMAQMEKPENTLADWPPQMALDMCLLTTGDDFAITDALGADVDEGQTGAEMLDVMVTALNDDKTVTKQTDRLGMIAKVSNLKVINILANSLQGDIKAAEDEAREFIDVYKKCSGRGDVITLAIKQHILSETRILVARDAARTRATREARRQRTAQRCHIVPSVAVAQQPTAAAGAAALAPPAAPEQPAAAAVAEQEAAEKAARAAALAQARAAAVPAPAAQVVAHPPGEDTITLLLRLFANCQVDTNDEKVLKDATVKQVLEKVSV